MKSTIHNSFTTRDYMLLLKFWKSWFAHFEMNLKSIRDITQGPQRNRTLEYISVVDVLSHRPNRPLCTQFLELRGFDRRCVHVGHNVTWRTGADTTVTMNDAHMRATLLPSSHRHFQLHLALGKVSPIVARESSGGWSTRTPASLSAFSTKV